MHAGRHSLDRSISIAVWHIVRVPQLAHLRHNGFGVTIGGVQSPVTLLRMRAADVKAFGEDPGAALLALP